MTITLEGPWHSGHAYDLHTLSSTCIGEDEYGHPIFDTTYSEMGQHLHSLKYEGRRDLVGEIVDMLSLWDSLPSGSLIIPVPASRHARPYQPLDDVALALGNRLDIPVLVGLLRKRADSKQLKEIADPQERQNALQDAISLTCPVDLSDHRVILIDDLYRSGATLTACHAVLTQRARAGSVSVITLTKTRVKK